MRRFTHLAAGLCLMLGLAGIACDDNNGDRSTFAAPSLSGANEVPPTGSTAVGSASFDVQGGTVTYTLELHGITNVTAAHIHLGAVAGNGPVAVNLFTGPTTGPVDGVLVQSTFSAADIQGGLSLESLLDQMRNNITYVNVHTTAFPDGEIRGQIQAVNQ